MMKQLLQTNNLKSLSMSVWPWLRYYDRNKIARSMAPWIKAHGKTASTFFRLCRILQIDDPTESRKIKNAESSQSLTCLVFKKELAESIRHFYFRSSVIEDDDESSETGFMAIPEQDR